MNQEIFYYYNDIKVVVRPKINETVYKFEIGEREIIQLVLPISDSNISRTTVNKYIDKLMLN